ncbi:hypothetical protein LY76DRAFT_586467 [Colletotrichum caudatum]|nr:hypothetical protein LY76DRAFT_586467 [Colletotrichum caudatum]
MVTGHYILSVASGIAWCPNTAKKNKLPRGGVVRLKGYNHVVYLLSYVSNVFIVPSCGHEWILMNAVHDTTVADLD